MNVTEKQAKKLWCPRDPNPDRQFVCLGAGCVWWQWDVPMVDGADSYVAEPPPTGHCGAASNRFM